MKILVVDDEKPARQRLIGLLREIGPDLQVVGEASNGVDAVDQCITRDVDLLLMDIRMPLMDGLDAAREIARLPHPPVVIFLTAFDEHALEAFDSNAIDYLLKPIRKSRLQTALEKAKVFNLARWKVLESSPLMTGRMRSHIAAHNRGEVVLMPVGEVRYFQADRKYVLACSATQRILIDEALKALEKEFSPLLVRVHRNALVSARYIRGVYRDPNGRLQVRLDGIRESIEVSRRHVSALRHSLTNRSAKDSSF
ncbi:MAG: LytTR family DNA-binding domain-containing protein [Methylococcaceae bacterium]|nr:LytTR family DNA-binding domain-containing protein [Methylococcaceae bacterium]